MASIDFEIPTCNICGQSEEETMCDVMEQSKCKLVLCRKCLSKHQANICEVCKRTLAEHKAKFKNNMKDKYRDTGIRQFEKQFQIRKEWEKYEEVSKEMIHLLAFFAKENLNKYENKYRKEVKDICETLKEQRNIVTGVKDYLNIPSMIGDGKGKTDLEEYNGKDACSYGKYDQPKGIKQIIQSFSDYE